MILYFLIIVIVVLTIDFVILWGLQGFSFKNFKNKLVDTTYWQKNYNTALNELDLQRKAHAHNTIAWTKQIEDFKSSEEYKDTKLKLASKTIKELRERLKELEAPKSKK